MIHGSVKSAVHLILNNFMSILSRLKSCLKHLKRLKFVGHAPVAFRKIVVIVVILLYLFYYKHNMQATRKWTYTEVQGFAEWDKARKEGKLGSPVRFETVKQLESWLHEQK